MNIAPVPFPLRFARPSQALEETGPAQWRPEVKGYSSRAPELLAKASPAHHTIGVTTQMGKFTDPPPEDVSSLEMYG